MLPTSSNGGFTEASKLIAASIVALYFFGLIFPLSKDVLSLIPS
jgi:hypothetical protein